MKFTCIFSFALIMMSPAANAQFYGSWSNSSSHNTSGYYRNNGTYVQPHHQTNPNNSTLDNYGTKGNYNPYTGSSGDRNPD